MAKKNKVLKYYAPHRSYPKDKYEELKETVVAVIEELAPELNVRFDMTKIVERKGTRGLLRNVLKREKFKPEDRYAFYNIIQELIRKDKFLFHKGGKYYARIA